MKQFLSLGLALVLGMGAAWAQSNPLLGKWKTKDDETGRIKSIVEITERDGMYYGEVVELFGFLMRTKTRIATSVRTTAKTSVSWAWRLSET